MGRLLKRKVMTVDRLSKSERDEREWPRQDVHLRGNLRVLGTRGGEILVRNLSKTGLMAETDMFLPCGIFVEVSLPGFASAKARVVWSEHGKIGVKFLTALA